MALEFVAGPTPNTAAGSSPLLGVRSRRGLLVAFASSMIHRVAAVLGGRRYSLALWAPAAQD